MRGLTDKGGEGLFKKDEVKEELRQEMPRIQSRRELASRTG